MEDEAFHAQIVGFQLNKMCRGMRGDEFQQYCLAHKFLWEGVPLKWWLPKVKPEFKWIIKIVFRENVVNSGGVIVNWLPLRRALYLSINRDDPTYVRHLFDLQPQRN